ncbi:MAG: response regulator transcription factor [Xanthomonadales bacterium]|nr:response regulator transcription factor [Xanthomonadales bacterium]
MSQRIPSARSMTPPAEGRMGAPVRVGVLEDDPDQGRLYQLWLESAGYRVLRFEDAGSFRRHLADEPLDIALIDWELPDSNGLEVLDWLRESPERELPVIFITVRDREADIVTALRRGADDYLVKPLRQGELMARITAVLRRAVGNGEQESPTEFGPYVLDPGHKRVLLDGREIPLTQREFELAAYLFRRRGRIVSREALLADVWKMPTDVPTRTIDTHMSRLRRKLELAGEHGWRLSAIYQHGYRLEPG